MCVFAIPLYHKPICRYLSFADTFAVYLGTTSLATNLLAMFALGEKVDGMTADLDINALLMGAASAKP